MKDCGNHVVLRTGIYLVSTNSYAIQLRADANYKAEDFFCPAKLNGSINERRHRSCCHAFTGDGDGDGDVMVMRFALLPSVLLNLNHGLLRVLCSNLFLLCSIFCRFLSRLSFFSKVVRF